MTRLTHGAKRQRTDADAAGDSRVDARTERWREHRKQVRAEFVEAAVRAIARFGPEVSMDDIAREAGAAKPKLYRHFENKLDLYAAIVAHVQTTLWTRTLGSINLVSDPMAELTRRCAAEYVLIVTENPNLFRFLVHGHFTRQGDESERALQAAQDSARRIATLFAETLDSPQVDVTRAELVAFSIFGAVASATDWWIGPNEARERPLPDDEFVRYLSGLVQGMIDAASGLAGITIDHDQPLHVALSART